MRLRVPLAVLVAALPPTGAYVAPQHSQQRQQSTRRPHVFAGHSTFPFDDDTVLRSSNIQRAPSTSSSSTCLSMAINGRSTSSKSQSPHPPKTPPPLSEEFYEQALKEYGASAETVVDLEQRVVALQKELAAKEAELEQQQEQWNGEKAQLMGQLLESGQPSPEDIEERKRLEREVELLQGQLPAIQNKLRTEQRKSEELEEKLADLDYTLEYQQMEFEKIQKQAADELEAEKKKLSQLQGELASKESQLQAQLKTKEQELQSELERMKEVESSLKGNQKAFAEEKARLVSNLQEKQSKLTETEANLAKERSLFATDKKQLQAEIVAERMRLTEAEKFLTEAEQLHRDIEKDLGDQLEKERSKVADLTSRLETEGAQFKATKEELYSRLSSQEASVSELQSTLEQERLESKEAIRRLTHELNEEIRIGKLKKRQMNDRFNAIRNEMTDLWQGALRDGRKQVQELQRKYEAKVASLQTSVAGLQEELAHALDEKESLTVLLRDMTQQRDSVVRAEKVAAKQHKLVVESKDEEIGELKNNLQALKQKVAAQQEEMTEFRGSVRTMLKEMVGLATGRVVVKPVKRLGRFIRRKKV